MDDSCIYRYRPRVTGEQSAYSWYPHAPRRPKEKEYEHQCATFQKTGKLRSDFIVNHEWLSDELKRDTIVPFRGRRWRPCPWEFHGARNWPYLTVEKRLEERRHLKALLSARDVPQEAIPVEEEEREELGPPIRFALIPQRTPWRPKTTWQGYIADEEGGVYGNPSRPPPRASSVSFSRHVKQLDEFTKHNAGYEEYCDHNTPYHWHQPDDVGRTGGSHMPPRYDVTSRVDRIRANDFMLPPPTPADQRPRFDRHFLNSANAMWIGTRYASSPGQI